MSAGFLSPLSNDLATQCASLFCQVLEREGSPFLLAKPMNRRVYGEH